MTAKRHDWFRFHVTDWLLGTNDLSLEQQAMYIKLLCVQWREGRIPGDFAKIAKLTVTHPKIVSRLCPTLLALKFNSSPSQVPLNSDSSPTQPQLKSNSGSTQGQLNSNSSTTYWINTRLEKERQLEVSKHDKLSAAGKKGGQISKPPRSIKKEKEKEKENKKEIPENKQNETENDSEFQKLAAMWRDMSRSKNNGWPKEDVWAKIKFRWLTQIKLLLTRDGFTKDQFVAVIKAFHSGALDSGDFVWARDAVKSPAKLRQPDKDGMVYMQVVLNRLAAIKIIPGLSPLRSFEDKYASDIYGLNSNRKGGAITEKVFQQSLSQLREKYNNWHRVESQGRYK